jgi:hypothetical protein
MVVVRIAPDIADEEHNRIVAEVLPPVRRSLGFGADFAGFVMDRRGAVAGVFDDLASVGMPSAKPTNCDKVIPRYGRLLR